MVKINDIFAASWGYEQTNWDFFKVIKVSATMVTVQPLKAVKSEDGPSAMRGTIVPTDEPTGDKPFRRKVLTYSGEPSLKIESYMYAHPWDGTPKHFTSYA